jgi:hypothetical protein
MALVVVVGVVLVAYSRQERLHPAASKSDTTPPTLTANWSQALSFDLCGKIEPSLPASPSTTTIGIKTSGGGIIHVQPLTQADTGHHATLGRFVTHYPGLTLTSTEVRYPGGTLYRNGDKCAGRVAEVQVESWSNPTSAKGIVTTDPASLLLENGQEITVAFLPPGTAIPKPSGTVVTALFNSMNQAVQSQSTTTTAPGSTSATTAATSSTTAPPSTTTSAPKSVSGSPSTTKP